MNFENSKFLKLLESKEVPLEKLSKVLCRGISCTDVKTVQEFVLKYEEENGTILLHQWKEIFIALGYLDEFSGVLQHAVGQFQRHHDSNPNVDADISLALSRPEASCVQTEDITRTTNLRALAQCSGAIPKKRPTPQKHIEFSADQVSVNGLHVDEDDSCVKDQVGGTLMTPGLPEPEKKVLSEQCCTVHDHSAASVTVVTEDACVQNSGQKGATDDETSLMESNFDLQQMSVDAVKGEVSEKPSAAPLGSTCLQTFQMEGNVEPDHGSIPFAAAGEDESGYFSVQNMETDTGMLRASNELTLVNNKENEEQCQQMSTALLHADSCQVQQPPAGLINDSTAVIPTMAEAVPSLPHESMLVTGQGNNSGLQSQETGNPSEHYNATENSMPVQDFQEGRIDRLQSNIIFLSQELEERTIAQNNLEVHSCRLQRELLDCRGRCTGLEEQNQELIQIQQEKHQMIAQTNQMLQWKQEECNQLEEMLHCKQEECNRLEEHIRESEAQYNNAIASMVTLRTTQTASQMALSELRREVQNLCEEREQFTLQERERLRRENERALDARFEEVCLAYHNAETDEVKGLKEKLSKEEETRKKTEETNKQLRQEVESLRTLLRQCSPHADRGAAFSDHVMPREEDETVDSTEDGSSSNASTSEVEMDNAAGSPGSIQQSETRAPDELQQQDQEFLEDAGKEVNKEN